MANFDPVQYKTTTRHQWDSAAEAWDRWGPTLEGWLGEATEKMLDAAGVTSGSKVLDVAAGAGGQSLTAARRAGSAGRVVASDISAGILAYAAKAAAEAQLTNVETVEADGERLEVFAGAEFDAVISRLGLIYFPDQQASLVGMGEAIRKGGRVSAIVYSSPDRNEFFSLPVSIIRRRAALPAPLPGQPGPFSLGGPGVLEAAFTAAGLRNVEVKTVPAPLLLNSAAECVRFEQESFGALHQMLGGVAEEERQDVWDEIHRELKTFEGPDGFRGPCELLVATGTK
ncbi:MAG: methyltransferase domain-containing protein [Actinobacteria bacterium]|nr:methyltransferase domain-containing protein [Actinomycetota bacterium]